MERKSIETIAIEARRQLELVRDRDPLVTWPKSMCGLCSRGAAILFRMLVKEGYSPTICIAERWPHSFIKLDDWIIDITATQFTKTKHKAVYIIPFSASKDTPAFTYGQYAISTEVSSVEDFIAYLEKKDRIQSEIPRDSDMEKETPNMFNNPYRYGFITTPIPTEEIVNYFTERRSNE